MRVSTQLSVLLAAASAHVSAQETGELGDAAKVTNNPVGVVYKATLPDAAFFKPTYPDGDNIEGEVTAVANPDGQGVSFTLKLSNLPKTGGPFPYHLHVDPVPENGNCTATLAHLDPYIRGEATACDKAAPATCQVGDLSGKWGAITPDEEGEFEATYVDLYASTLEGIGAFFGNRSIVFHHPNKTRITCANFEQVTLPGPGDDDGDDGSDDGDDDDNSGPSPTSVPSAIVTPPPSNTGNGTAPPLPTSSIQTAGAAGLKVGITTALVAAAAFAMML
ncbi:superoxide dismutase [Chaetomium sp. MPI-CAGE-AT-0009]|nr:superoxide dismutase [Chaetomium sp. MPI-CAGE-AT-0009]